MKILFLILFLFSLLSFSYPHWNRNLILAQNDEPVFDDSDLADIEGSDVEDDFDAFEGEGDEYNFDEDDFEEIEETEAPEDSSDNETIDDGLPRGADKDDFETIEDKEDLEEELEEKPDKTQEETDKGEFEDSSDNETTDDELPEGADQDDFETIEDDEDLEKEFEEKTDEITDDQEKLEDSSDDETTDDELPEGADEDDFETIEDDEDLEEEFEEETDETIDDQEKLEDSSDDETTDDELPEGADEDDFETIEDDEDLEEEFEGETDETTDDSLGAVEDQIQDEPEDTQIEESQEEIIDSALTPDETDINATDETLTDEAISEGALNLITNIRYLADQDQIVIDCSEPTSYQVRTNEETNQFIIEILQAKLADNLHWPYVLRDFNTKFGLIKADQKDPSTVRIIVQLKEGSDFPKSTLTEDSDQILIGYGEVDGFKIVKSDADTQDSSPILPSRTLQDLYFENIKFSGQPISIHVIDAPIKQVLRFISEESGLNMVIGESVQGTVTLKLEDVPWDQALFTIFKVKSLGYTRDGNVITVLPLKEIEDRISKLKNIADQQKSLSPYKTKVIPINYAKIEEIEEKVKLFSTPKTKMGQEGQIITSEETNTFVVIDAPEVIEKIESLVKYLDKPPKQVMVSAKIVEAEKTFSNNIGLQWSLGGNLSLGIAANGFLDFFQNIGKTLRFNVSEQGPGSITFNLRGLPFVGNFDSSLSLAETEGHVKIISSPKLVVISGKTAELTRNAPILIPGAADASPTGAATPGTTSAATPGTTGQGFPTISFQEVEIQISLRVTPTVTPTGNVFLQIEIIRTDPGADAGVVGQAIRIQREAKTEILTKNGQTVVIGGLHEQFKTEGNQGIPLLKNIPFFKRLFGKQNTIKRNTELLIFITPKLLDDNE